MNESIELSIIMPCLNEAETLAICINKARGFLERAGISGEVVIADNGSTDGSPEIARANGARVVAVAEKGYGSALRGGIEAARGRYVIMGDADDSYDFVNLMPFIERLRLGDDLVMGNRFRGGIKPGAMPPLHRYLGNPVLTWIGRLFFGSPCGDFHCGLRGFNRESIRRLELRTSGMEFASEMIVRASLERLRISEVPTTLSKDGRSRPPHLRSWRDGWRHLRFLLMYSPRWLFLYPGLVLVMAGLLVGGWLLPQPRQILGVVFDFHTLFYAGLAVVIGYQSVIFAVSTLLFVSSEGLLPQDRRLNEAFARVSLEAGLMAGLLLVLLGLAGTIWAVADWGLQAFGPLEPGRMMRLLIPSGTALVIGCQTIFASFFLSILGLRRR
ncbi:MAG: glycosyltransferase family 2 protein [Acidobacteriota bacterium]|jgi:glycosyltransferase involved in cell wall biosynthesis